MGKNVLLLSLASFFTDAATAMVVSVLPVFVVFHLKVGYDKLGVIVGVATFVSYLLRVVFGFLSDRFGVSKPFLLLGYGLSALSKPLFSFANDWKEVALLRAADRLGKAVRSAPRDRLLSLSAGKAQGRTFGFHKSFDVAGEFLGATIALLLLTFVGTDEGVYKNLFLLSAIPGALALVSLLPVEEKRTPPKGGFSLAEGDKRLILPVLLAASVPLFVWFLPFFLTLSVERKLLSEGLVPLAYMTTQGVQIVLGYPSGYLLDIWKTRSVFLLSLTAAAGSLISLSLGWVWLSFVLLGVHQVFYFTAVRSFIGKRATDRGTVYGFFYATYGVFGALGSLLVGFAVEHFGFSTALLYSLSGALLLSVATLRVMRD